MPGYESAWQREEDLAGLNLRLHEGVPLDKLAERAAGWRDRLFGAYPQAAPADGARVVEFGSGVGWIMEAMLERFPGIGQIIGLDISEPIARAGRERLQHPAARFVVYDGRRFPFRDGGVDVIYSCAAIQHVEKHAAFLQFEEMHRVLAPGGHAVLHFMSVDHIAHAGVDYEAECVNHVEHRPEHWHHYYSFDELYVIFSELIRADDLDIRATDEYDSFIVHFSKGTGRRHLRPGLPRETFSRRPRGLAGRLFH